jgi:DNA-binding transcriptional LysR family regulator
MLDLNDLRLFVQVVDSGGIARAAQALGMTPSSVSRRLAALEHRLELRLVERNAKNFSVTESGREIYRHCLDLAASARAAEDRVEQHAREPSGRVRLSSSIAFGQVVLPELLARFVERFPNVRVSVEVANRPNDSINAGFDVLLRAHTWDLNDSALVQRRVCVVPMLLVAPPVYLDRVGRPKTPDDLGRVELLAFGFADQDIVWELACDGEPTAQVPVQPRALIGDMVALRSLLLRVGGVAQLPDYLVRADLAEGRLERVLPSWSARDSIATILLPARRGIAPGARALADFIAADLPEALARVGVERT